MTTFTSLFTCAGGADEGARQAGLRGLNGFEIDPKSAAIAQENGHNVTVADICGVNFDRYEAPYWLHASPVCGRASIANRTPLRGEAAVDIDTAKATIRAIVAWRPEVVSIENVIGYVKFAAYDLLLDALINFGYNIVAKSVNCWEHGVPQTRRRLIVVASRSSQPVLPTPTPTACWATPDLLARLATYPTYEAGGYSADVVRALRSSETLLVDRHFGGRFLPVDRPAMTLMADHYLPIVWLGDQQRTVRLTIADRGVLHTFPRDYEWGVSKTIAGDAIGMAVPPELMRRLVKANI